MTRVASGPGRRLPMLALALCLVLAPGPACRADPGAGEAVPPYVPQQQVSGLLRNHGFGFGGLLKVWERGFQRFQPGVHFQDTLITSDAAFAALVTGVTDLAPDGGEPALTEALAFYETYGYDATPVVVASGTYDVDGRSPGIVVLVHRDNPLTRLSLAQLDGIFGAQRSGALRGFKWQRSAARGADANLRTWGQLGLGGAWADRPIQTYGHAPSGTTRFFQLRVLHNSDKWNPNYREYVESGSKMIGEDDPHQLGGVRHMLADELAHDRYGIAWTTQPQAAGVPGLKAIALSATDGGPAVLPSRQSFRDRSYPLVRNLYFFINRRPGAALDPKLREFLRYVLSREGQQAIEAEGGYLPLPPAMAEQQRRRLD